MVAVVRVRLARVEPGREDDFVAAWREFVGWASEQRGSGMFRLVRDVEHPGRFMSFVPWESFEAQRAWKESDEFAARLRRVRDHVESFEPSTYELARRAWPRHVRLPIFDSAWPASDGHTAGPSRARSSFAP
jgi:heme-degrading monooxygenase HmoA